MVIRRADTRCTCGRHRTLSGWLPVMRDWMHNWAVLVEIVKPDEIDGSRRWKRKRVARSVKSGTARALKLVPPWKQRKIRKMPVRLTEYSTVGCKNAAGRSQVNCDGIWNAILFEALREVIMHIHHAEQINTYRRAYSFVTVVTEKIIINTSVFLCACETLWYWYIEYINELYLYSFIYF